MAGRLQLVLPRQYNDFVHGIPTNDIITRGYTSIASQAASKSVYTIDVKLL